MAKFGSGISAAEDAVTAAREAAGEARAALGDATPKLAIVFASISYDGVERVADVVREVVGDAPMVGGSSGACVFASDRCMPRGVSVVLLGGDAITCALRSVAVSSPSLVEAVEPAAEIAREADAAAEAGFSHYACLVFAPGISVDGEALVAAVRKGAGARAQLAGALTGDELTLDRPKVLVDGELRSDRVVVAGVFARTPIGIGARHGWRAAGPVRKVTRADGADLVHLDGRPALDVWLEDARRAGGAPPRDPRSLPLFLANHYALGIAATPSRRRRGVPEDPRELVARTPFGVGPGGRVRLSASLPEGTRVRILHATRRDLLRASRDAADAAVDGAGGEEVAGALVLACSGRLAALGESFPDEPAEIQRRVAAPIGGACVYGEIARNVRDADAFFNTTAVVVAFGT